MSCFRTGRTGATGLTLWFGFRFSSPSASPRVRGFWIAASSTTQCLQYLLDRDRPVEKSKSHQHHFDKKLLLPAAAELRLESGQHRQHAEDIAGRKFVAVRLQYLESVRGHARRLSAKNHGELSAQHVSQPRTE